MDNLMILEKMRIEKLKDLKFCVYEYIEAETLQVRYIGIVNNGDLANRHKAHINDEWYGNKEWVLKYIQCNNQSETEAIESHLISLYPEEQLYNKAKIGWGTNRFLPNEYDWKEVNVSMLDVLDGLKNYIEYSKLFNDNSAERTILLEYIKILKVKGAY